MNFKIVVSAALLALSTTAVNTNVQAQSATVATSQKASTAKTFNTLISQYEKATDKLAENAAFGKLTDQMTIDMGINKQKIVDAGNDAASAKKHADKLDQMGNTYNEVIKASRSANGLDKPGVITALKKFASLL
jgi:hypothetical protein